MPWMSSRGVKPGKRYASSRRRRLGGVAMRESCHGQHHARAFFLSAISAVRHLTVMRIYPHYSEKTRTSVLPACLNRAELVAEQRAEPKPLCLATVALPAQRAVRWHR